MNSMRPDVRPAGRCRFTQVDTAHTAEQALTLARHHAYHLILMDLSMPGMDGVQLISELAQLRLNPMLAITTPARAAS